jgi:hypothetical protein
LTRRASNLTLLPSFQTFHASPGPHDRRIIDHYIRATGPRLDRRVLDLRMEDLRLFSFMGWAFGHYLVARDECRSR